MQLSKTELWSIKGGSLSATFLNALSRAVSTILDVGRSIGSSIRRIFSRSIC